MKNLRLTALVLAIIMAMAGTQLSAQDKTGFIEVFEEYAQRKNAISFTFNKTILDAVDMDFEWEEKIRNVEGDIHRIKFISFDSEDESTKIITRLDEKITQLGYPVIIEENEQDDIRFLKIYGSQSKGFFRQVHLLLQDDEGHTFLISLDGKLKVSGKA